MFLPDRVIMKLIKTCNTKSAAKQKQKRMVFVIKHLRWATSRNIPMSDDALCAVCHQQPNTGVFRNTGVSSLDTVAVTCQSAGVRSGSAAEILLRITEHYCTRDVKVVYKLSWGKVFFFPAGYRDYVTTTYTTVSFLVADRP